METIEVRIENFFSIFNPTIELLNKFTKTKSYHQEFILLVCARLDALANIAFRNNSRRENFINFLDCYSGYREDFSMVSVGDLYAYFAYQLTVLPYELEKEGRLAIFTSDWQKTEEKFARLVWEVGLPITQKAIRDFIKNLMSAMKAKYYVLPKQRNQDQILCSKEELINVLSEAFKAIDSKIYELIQKNSKYLANLIEDFKLSSLLYTNYRCSIIHELYIEGESKFFYKNIGNLYWEHMRNSFVKPELTLTVQFPANFLLKILQTGINNYKKKLLDTKKLPIELYRDICDFTTEEEYLDMSTVSVRKEMRFGNFN